MIKKNKILLDTIINDFILIFTNEWYILDKIDTLIILNNKIHNEHLKDIFKILFNAMYTQMSIAKIRNDDINFRYGNDTFIYLSHTKEGYEFKLTSNELIFKTPKQIVKERIKKEYNQFPIFKFEIYNSYVSDKKYIKKYITENLDDGLKKTCSLIINAAFLSKNKKIIMKYFYNY